MGGVGECLYGLGVVWCVDVVGFSVFEGGMCGSDCRERNCVGMEHACELSE